MVSVVSTTIIIILKIKGLIELLNQFQGNMNNNNCSEYISCLIDIIKKAKEHIVLHQGTEKIVESLENILIEIQNSSIDLSKIITKLQVICNEVSSIYTAEKEALNVINNLITSTRILFRGIAKL